MVDVAVRDGVSVGAGVGFGVQSVGLPLVVDALTLYVKSARNMMKILSCILKH
uniref:Uncharacterized protein n=1 Tax=Solanum tuberosum TaxID=4113 RepID=M1A840_SOLTU